MPADSLYPSLILPSRLIVLEDARLLGSADLGALFDLNGHTLTANLLATGFGSVWVMGPGTVDGEVEITVADGKFIALTFTATSVAVFASGNADDIPLLANEQDLSSLQKSQVQENLSLVPGTDIASLVGGKIPVGQLPPIAVDYIVPVEDEAGRLALTTAQATGKQVKQADNGRSYGLIIDGDPAETGDWIELGDALIEISDVVGLPAVLAAETAARKAATVDFISPIDLFSTRPLFAFMNTEWDKAAKFVTVMNGAPTIEVSSTTGYARGLRWDGTLAAVSGTGATGSAFVVSFGAAPAAPYNDIRPRFVAVFPCNSGGVINGDLDSIFAPGNSIVAFSGVRLSSLTSINLSSNNLTAFSGVGLSSLTSLELGSNSLTAFSGVGLSSLTYLGLGSNRLTSFSGIGLSSLIELNLGANNLTAFSGTGLSELSYLNLVANSLTSFSGVGLSSLTYLYISYNSLTSFSGVGLSSLTFLDLGNNQLASLTTAGMPLLNALKLENNQLESVNVNGAILSYGSATYYGSDFRNNLLDGAALNTLYTSLGEDLGSTGVILVAGNPGTAADDPTIATAKGYTVIGT